MAHLAGLYLLGEDSHEAKRSRQLLQQALSTAEARVAVFEDQRLLLVYADYGNFASPGYREDDGSVAALAGELILDRNGEEGGGRGEDLQRLALSLRRGAPGALAQANGTFALCCYQNAEGRLVLATDALGARPLYYCVAGSVLCFSTAFKFLLRLPIVPRRVDLAALAEQHAFCYPLSRRTLLRDVSVLRDAEFLAVEKGQVRIDRYLRWDAVTPAPKDRRLELRGCYSAFRSALASRSHGPGPHLALLSGGLDSRCVVAGLKDLGKEVRAYNCSPAGSQDWEYARRYAESAGVPLERVSWSPDMVESSAGKTTARLLARATEKCRGKAVFSADGGGETLAFLMMMPPVMGLLGEGRITEAIKEYTRGRWIPKTYLRREAAAPLRAFPAEGMKREFESLSHLPPQKAMQLFLLRNDLRRHLHHYFENIDESRVELLLPFYDRRVLESVIRIAPPLGDYLRHRFYYEWLELLPASVRSVPWQIHPTHEPCPIPDPAPPLTQWQVVQQARPQVSRRLRAKAVRLVWGPKFPRRMVRRWPILLAAAASAAGSHRYDYVFESCIELCEGCGLDQNPEQVAPQPESENE